MAQSSELVLAASRSQGKKGQHIVLLVEPSTTGLRVLWMLKGVGALGGPPTLMRDGLTRPFETLTPGEERFVPRHKLPVAKLRKGYEHDEHGEHEFSECF